MSKRRLMDVRDGSMIGWHQPLDPLMLTKKGLVVPAALPGLQLRFGREYALGKIKHEIGESLGLNKDDLLKLIDEAYQVA